MITSTVLVRGQRTCQDDVSDLFHRLRAAAGRLPGFARVPDWRHTPHPNTGFANIDDPFFGHYRYEFLAETGHAYPSDDMPVRLTALYRADGFTVLDSDPELEDPDHLIRVWMDYGTFDLHG